MSVITFESSAQQVVPLTELAAFQPPSTQASGSTALGEALTLLANRIESEVVKGDWKPLVFLMTDGGPTDDWQKGINDLKKAKTGIVVACAAGPNADTSVLKQIPEVVVRLDTADTGTIKAFIKGLLNYQRRATNQGFPGGLELHCRQFGVGIV